MAAVGRGFSLVELLVTVTVAAILTSLALGSYRQYLRRVERIDATSALLRIAAAQEAFYAQQGQYADNTELRLAPPAGLGVPGTERGLYSLAVTPDANGLAAGFTATATVIASGRQHDDLDCWAFSINERGERSAQSQSGATSAAITERCWR